MESTRRALLSDRVYDDLRRSIMAGEIKPGQLLNEAELASQYGTSKTPVREALGRLAFEGLLGALPSTGYLVRPITMDDVIESFHLRLLLELEAATLAAERISAADLCELERILAMQETVAEAVDGHGTESLSTHTKDLVQSDDERPSKLLHLNRDFHLIIARASGSRRLAKLVEGLLEEMERMLAMDFGRPAPRDHGEHRALLEALKRHDPQVAREAMRKNVERSKAHVLERF